MCFTDTTIRSEQLLFSPNLTEQLGYATGANEPVNRIPPLSAGVTDADISTSEYLMKLDYASLLLKPPLLWSLKIVMAVFFLRLTNNLRWMRKMTIATMVICVLTFLAAEGTIVLQCIPIKNKWDIFDYDWRNCSNSFATHTEIVNYLVVGISNIVTDLLLVVIPIPMLWQVRLPKLRKIGTGFLLCSGIFIIAINVVRTTCAILSYRAEGQRALHLRETAFAWVHRSRNCEQHSYPPLHLFRAIERLIFPIYKFKAFLVGIFYGSDEV